MWRFQFSSDKGGSEEHEGTVAWKNHSLFKIVKCKNCFSTFSSLRLSLREVPELKKMMAVMCGHQRGRKAELAAAVWQQAERRVNINHGLVDAEARQDRQVQESRVSLRQFAGRAATESRGPCCILHNGGFTFC